MRLCKRTFSLACFAVLMVQGVIFAEDFTSSQAVSFSEQIAPIFQARCVTCHGPKLAESDYRMDTFSAITQMTSNDEPAVVPIEPKNSKLYQRLVHEDEDLRMPSESEPLPDDEIDLIRNWIAQGAAFDGDSRQKSLSDLIPVVNHPPAPEHYRAGLPISAIALHGEEPRIFVGGYYEITAWNIKGELLNRIGNLGQRTYAIAPHPTENRMLTASGTPGILGEVRIVNPQSGEVTAIVARADEAILDAQYSPDGQRIAVALPNGSIEIYDATTLSKTVTLLGHSDQITSVRWHADSNRLGTTSRDNAAKIYDVDAGKSITTFAGHTGCVNSLAFLDGNEVITVSDDGKATIWSATDGRRIRDILSTQTPVLDVARFDRHFWIAGTRDAQQFEIGSNRKLARLESEGEWVTVMAKNSRPDLRVFGLHSGELMIRQGEQALLTFVAHP